MEYEMETGTILWFMRVWGVRYIGSLFGGYL